VNEDLMFHENSKRFDSQRLLHEPLAATHEFFTLVFGAEDIGLPWARKRSLSLGWKRSKLVWLGDLSSAADEFYSMFKEVPVLSGDDYLVDEEHVAPEMRELCASRGHWYDESADAETMISVPDEHLYNPTQLNHKLLYTQRCLKNMRSQHPSGCFQMDLNQNPLADRSSCGPYVPRMCTHGCLRSLVRGRNFTKRELLYAIGLPRNGGWLANLIDGWTYNEVLLLNALCVVVTIPFRCSSAAVGNLSMSWHIGCGHCLPCGRA
jgi:hypothetical protein